jgi:hypothetical protein
MALKVGDLLATLKADTSNFDKKMKGATGSLVSPGGLLGAFTAVSAAVVATTAAMVGASERSHAPAANRPKHCANSATKRKDSSTTWT